MRNRLYPLFALLVITALTLSACGTSAPADNAGGDELSGTISVSGAFALYPMMTVWAEEFTKIHPDVQFDVQGGGAGKGMTDTLAGAVDIGMISRAIKPEEESQGAYWVAVTKDAVLPIISADNPVADQIQAQGISQEIFGKIFVTQEIKTWGEVVGDPSITDEIHVYTRSDSAGAAEQWAKYSGGKAQDDLKGIGINGEPAMVDTIIKDPLGIGFGNLNSVFDLTSGGLITGILVPPIDINANGQVDAGESYKVKADIFNAVSQGTFPEPPARFEYLATKGKPSGLVQAFIEWILTDGQQYLEAAGYVPLTAEQQAESLDKLK
ncbi:MAG: substrate-binding domain-containing protein [Chloroflexi bacterium]|nr:substrate-binding domain-containing protein [Chloroflexota bacterium]